jgi:hypothetical protein
MRNIRNEWVVGRSRKWKWRRVNVKMLKLTTKNKELKRRLVEWTTL